MENRISGRVFLPILIVFFVINFLVILGRSLLRGWDTDYRVLLVGNAVLLLVTITSFYLYIKGLRSNSAYSFVRVMYGSLLVKMLVCLVAVFFYAWLAGPPNRNAILGCFGLYILYTYLEVSKLTQLSRMKNA